MTVLPPSMASGLPGKRDEAYRAGMMAMYFMATKLGKISEISRRKAVDFYNGLAFSTQYGFKNKVKIE
jgi:hypothetical protein